MERIHYFTLVEGGLDEFFLKPLLYGIAKGLEKEIEFDRSPEFSGYERGKKNKQKVFARVKTHADEIILFNSRGDKRYLLIIGVDSDSSNQSDIDECWQKIVSDIQDFAKQYCLLFVAVQEMETWVAYLDKPSANANSLEGKGSFKRELYQPKGKSTGSSSIQLVNRLKEQGCFQSKALLHLCDQSQSFKSFHQQILDYLVRIS